MTILIYPNNTVKVDCPNKTGISTTIDIICYPFNNKFLARNGRSNLIRQRVYLKGPHELNFKDKIDCKIAIIRDPIERLASCFADRVLKKNRQNCRETIKDWDFFVKNLQSIRDTYKDIRVHSEPQTHWIGTDPKFYDHIFYTKELNTKFTDLISKLSGCSIPKTSHRKSTGNLKNTFTITNEHKDLIRKYYNDEYKYWANYFQ